jgi:uncharacterized protein with NAD-binding domain and iron-sulfur cluster
VGADPRLFAVDLIVHCQTLYPRHYPLTTADDVNVRHLGHGLEADLGRLLDERLILPHVDRLYALVAATVDRPELQRLIKDGVPIYPSMAATTARAADRPRVRAVAAAPPGAPRAMRKPRVLILGAGMGGLSAAWELTSYPGWADLYDVTVHVLGWRVGGKTATGRGPAARVQEHGIHILQGWYHNLFRVMNEVYAERAGSDGAPPWKSWYDALERNDSTFLTEYLPEARQWANTTVIFPRGDGLPGEGPPLSAWEAIKKLVALACELVLGSPYARGEGPFARWILDHFFPPPEAEATPTPGGRVAAAIRTAGDHIEHEASVIATHAISKIRSALDRLHVAAHAPVGAVEDVAHPPRTEAGAALAVGEEVLGILEKMLERVREELAPADARLRLIVEALEFVSVSLRGLLEEVWDPITRTFQWSRIEGEDFRAWLARWGASDLVLRSPIVRFAYTGLFANLADGRGRGGLVSASTSLRTLIEAGGYKGSFVWQLRAGTGETMMMPLYDVLVARGVRFEFFRKVQRVDWSDTGQIETITVGEQVTLRDGAYDPAVVVDGLRAWPAEPLYAQLDPAEARLLQERHVDLEDPWSDWACVRNMTMVRGQDFDQLVLAIPVAALRDCCSEVIAADSRWERMVNEVKTTGTLGVQLWIRRSLEELGMERSAWGLAPRDCAPNAVTYQSLLYSWLDQSCVLPFEQWPADETPKLAAYFTGTLDDPPTIPPYTDHDFPLQQLERVKGLTLQWLQDNMAFFWPKATTPEFPNGFDLTLLCHPTDAGASAGERFDAQFFRANLSPTMRYTLSVPGSDAFRLGPDDSGFANLFLAGDWTDFGLNVGYIEGALISGLLAAQALRRRWYGQTAHRVIWTDPQHR